MTRTECILLASSPKCAHCTAKVKPCMYYGDNTRSQPVIFNAESVTSRKRGRDALEDGQYHICSRHGGTCDEWKIQLTAWTSQMPTSHLKRQQIFQTCLVTRVHVFSTSTETMTSRKLLHSHRSIIRNANERIDLQQRTEAHPLKHLRHKHSNSRHRILRHLPQTSPARLTPNLLS